MRVALGVAVLMCLLVPATSSAAGRCGTHPWCDTSLTADQRADLLMKALTPTERASLLGGDELSGVAGGEGTHTGTSNGVPRVGLPTMYLSDGPAGTRQGKATKFAAPIGMAAAFDRRTAEKAGALVGDEVRKKGNDVVFAPTVDIMRTPLGGRTFEAYGEDPYLSSNLGVAWAKGAGGQGVIVNVKHFAGNNQEGYAGPAANQSDPSQPLGPTPIEGNRFTADSRIDERPLREIYLAPYEAVLSRANVGSIMCSYKRLNGTYACQNKTLLDTILRREWGFKGFVIADYGAAHDPVANLNNGLDFEPWPGQPLGPASITAAMLAGQVTQATVDEHVRRILRTLFAYGFFDRDAYPDDTASIDQRATRARPRRSTSPGITLLRNQGDVLPLDPKKLRTIALIGADAAVAKGGGRVLNIDPFFTSCRRNRSRPGPDPASRRPTTTAADPDRARRAREVLRRRDRRRRRLPDRGRGPRLPDAGVPDDPRRPGRADREGRRRGQPQDRRRARDRRAGADALARAGRGPRRGVVSGADGRHRRSRACCSATSTRAAGCPRRSRSPRPTCRRRATRASTRAWPSASTTSRACSSATAGSTRSARSRRTRSASACPTRASATASCA